MVYFKIKNLQDETITINLQEFLEWSEQKLLNELEKYPFISLKKIIYCLHKIMARSQALAKKMPHNLAEKVGDFIIKKEEDDEE